MKHNSFISSSEREGTGVDVRRLFAKIGLLGLPLVVLVAVYLYFDPFKVLRSYTEYYPAGDQYVFLNRDYVSTALFLKQYPLYHYDAFIFGSSRSLAFHVSDWQPYLRSRSAYHFDATAESLYGIAGKLRLMDKMDIPMRDVIIVLDYWSLSVTQDSPGMLFIKHPAVSQGSRFLFQMEFFKAYLNPFFLFPYLHMRLTGTFHPYMLSLNPLTQFHDSRTNDYYILDYESALASNPDEYYRKREKIFYKRPSNPGFTPEVIGPAQLVLLREIAAILRKHSTDYRIILNPLYDEKRLDSRDLARLQELFAAENVWDFTGANEFTIDYHKWYEALHFRDVVARRIMQIVYAGPVATPRIEPLTSLALN
jgi:hypothetical protein